MVLLMARLPPVERGAGSARLAHWHLLGSRYVAGAAEVYALLAGAAYMVTGGTGTQPLPGYPQVATTAVAGLALLGADAAVARGWLTHQAWYFLHPLGYGAIAAVIGPEFACVYGRVAWIVLLLAAMTAVTWYRIVAPARNLARHRLRVTAVRLESPDLMTVDISGLAVRELHAAPGQFFRWRFLARGLWWQSQPYPASFSLDGNTVRITIRARGRRGDPLTQLRTGTRVIAEGPSAALPPSRRRVLLLAFGTGIAALRAVLIAMPPGSVTLIYRSGHPDDIASGGELATIAAARGARVYHVNGRCASGPLSAPQLQRLLPADARRDVYLYGPSAMTAVAVTALQRAGVPSERIGREPPRS